MPLKFTWDPAKAEANWQKHKISFIMATEAFFDPDGLELLDEDLDYGETRFKLIGLARTKLLLVVYSELSPDGLTIRLISARKANAADREKYYGR